MPNNKFVYLIHLLLTLVSVCLIYVWSVIYNFGLFSLFIVVLSFVIYFVRESIIYIQTVSNKRIFFSIYSQFIFNFRTLECIFSTNTPLERLKADSKSPKILCSACCPGVGSMLKHFELQKTLSLWSRGNAIDFSMQRFTPQWRLTSGGLSHTFLFLFLRPYIFKKLENNTNAHAHDAYLYEL